MVAGNLCKIDGGFHTAEWLLVLCEAERSDSVRQWETDGWGQDPGKAEDLQIQICR